GISPTSLPSVSQALSNQFYMDAASFSAAFYDAPHVANALSRPAVRAQPIGRAGCFDADTNRVYRRDVVFDPRYGGIQVGGDFIHSHHQDHFFGTKHHGRHPVSQAVQVDESAV